MSALWFLGLVVLLLALFALTDDDDDGLGT